MKLKWRLLIILAMIGVMFTWQGFPDWLALKKPAVDITELWYTDFDDLVPGTHVCFDVTLVWDKVGTSTEQSKTFGITTSERTTGQYYLLPLCTGEDDGYIYPDPFLLVWCSASYESAMTAQIEKSDAWWQSDGDFDSVPTSSLHFDGILRKIPSNIKKQMNSNLLNSGENFDDYFMNCMFKPIAAPGGVTAMTIIGLLCLMVTLVILFIMLMSARNKTAPAVAAMPAAAGAGFVPQDGMQTAAPVPQSGFVPQPSQPVQSAFAQPQPVQSAFAQQPIQQSAFVQSQPDQQQALYGQQPLYTQQPAYSQPAPQVQQPASQNYVQQPAYTQPTPVAQPAAPVVEDTSAAKQAFAGAFATPSNQNSNI